MARYKLGVFNKKEVKVIELDNIVKLKELKFLDKFTSNFNNESELKVYLFNCGLITDEELGHNIGITYKYDGKFKKLPIIYKNMKEYLDIYYLKYTLKSLCNDIEFLEKLARHYSIGSDKFNPQGVNVSDIRRYIGDIRAGREAEPMLLETAINDLFRKAVLKKIDKKPGELKQDDRGLRDLALFMYKYKKYKEEIKEKQTFDNSVGSWQQSSLFNDNYIQEINSREIALSSDGDPDFPFNSEEEEMYNEYLEKFPDEEHPHYRR